ncbi:magnesium transporter NIPA-domain-containing protein [Exophiala viscosa]|uniref:Magnesium transporter NIPA-domain-containing protein n=1 Tax=Exophiala viscosa TaxID=2486360 RepID=A0AAN6E556_9EURO|nr:magnesium transporter NIPA-domain-containing protein [Exophiala viscosa]
MLAPTFSSTRDAPPTNILGLFVVALGTQPDEDSRLQRWSSFIGIVTAIIGNLLISFALNTQRYAHILIEREHNERKRPGAQDPSSERPGSYGTSEQEHAAEVRRRVNLGLPDPKEGANGNGHTADGNIDGSPHLDLEPSGQKSEPDTGDDQDRPSYLKSPWWWLGLVLMIVGEAGNFLAYGFAPASIVSPLGVVALISNCLIAPLMLKERFRKRDFLGVLVAIAGAVVVVLSASTSEEKFGPGALWRTIKRWEFLVYVLITMLLIVALVYVEPRYNRRTILVDLGLVGLFGGYTALSTKGVASLLSASLYKAFTYPIFYFLAAILVSSALMQIRYLNSALQNYDSTQVIPTQFVLFTLSVIIGSAVLYRDFEHATADQAVKFVSGCLLTFFGVYLITSAREDPEASDDYEEHEDETIQLLDEETEDVDERTPLRRDGKRANAYERDEYHSTLGTVEESDGEPLTPRPGSRASSAVPSIAVTPAESSDNMLANPWASSTEDIDAPLPPRTPNSERLPSTPFFTPFTSNSPLKRSTSSPAGTDTPIKLGTPRLPSPERPGKSWLGDPSPILMPHSTRGSISRLLPFPGPLLPPLSSSLSALVADSLLKGEGAPRSVRAALRRSRSERHSPMERRQTMPVPDDVNPLGLHFQNRSVDRVGLSRAATHEGAVRDELAQEADDPNQRRTRLRALSESIQSIMGRSKGKKRDDLEGGVDETDAT